MKPFARLMWWTLLGAGVVALSLEALVWTGRAEAASRVSEVVSYVVVFALVSLGGLACFFEESVTVAGPATTWATLPLILGVLCRQLGDALGAWRGPVQALYALSLAGSLFWGWACIRRLARVPSARFRLR